MLTDTQRKVYSRNIALAQIGQQGQEVLLDAKVLVVGAGGLGSPLLLYLAAAGVGTIGIVDSDRVEISNLQRQVIFFQKHIGQTKVLAAKSQINKLNPEIKITTYKKALTAANASEIMAPYEIIADCSDNFVTRFVINDTSIALKKTLVSAAVTGFTGHVAVFKAYLGENYPCYRCFCPDLPPENLLPNCSSGGVLGSVAGVIGSLQATEIIKEILEIGSGKAAEIIIYDGLKSTSRKVKLKKRKNCSCQITVK